MKRTANSTMKVQKVAELDPAFVRVVDAFVGDRQVSHGGSKGFGSGALKVKGKIFAMMSSKGEFVVKLSKVRVDELVDSGEGQRFDPSHGRTMKEWIVIEAGRTDWIELAREAYDFVKRSGSRSSASR